MLAWLNELSGAKGLLLRAGSEVNATLIAARVLPGMLSGESDLQMK